MKKRIIVGVVLLFVLAFTAACGQDTEITGKVVDVEKYGHVVLDITTEEFGQAGFELGDIVTVNAAAEKYLKDHGMAEKTLKKLEERLK